MIGLPATVSAYGRAPEEIAVEFRQLFPRDVCELLGEELNQCIDVVGGREVSRTARSVAQLCEQAPGLVAVDPGGDDRRALVVQRVSQSGAVRNGDDGDHARESCGHQSPSPDSANAFSTSARASTASAIATSVATAKAVSTASSPHVPPGDWVSASTSAIRSAVARKASSPVISYSTAPPHPTSALAGCHTPSPRATTRSWSSTAASRSSTSPPSSKERARKATAAP